MTDSIQCLYGVSIIWMVVHLLIIYVTPQHGMQLMIWWNESNKSFVHEYISYQMTGQLWPMIQPIASPWYHFCRIAGLQKWGFILMKIVSNLSSRVGVASHCWEKALCQVLMLWHHNAITITRMTWHPCTIKMTIFLYDILHQTSIRESVAGIDLQLSQWLPTPH